MSNALIPLLLKLKIKVQGSNIFQEIFYFYSCVVFCMEFQLIIICTSTLFCHLHLDVPENGQRKKEGEHRCSKSKIWCIWRKMNFHFY